MIKYKTAIFDIRLPQKTYIQGIINPILLSNGMVKWFQRKTIFNYYFPRYGSMLNFVLP
jgi:hypothetical protein